MIKLQDGRYIIGVDTGYEYCKTCNTIGLNGVISMGEAETSLMDNSLFYNGEFYKIGENRALITENKISDENTRLLTMAAMAKELKREDIMDANIVLGVGLPFSDYGRDKKGLISYYCKIPELNFEYEGIQYHIALNKVLCFPQSYAAVATRLSNMQGNWIVIDIGGKTTDIVYVVDGFPKESQSMTIERALVKWIKEIQSALQVRYGKSIPEEEVVKVIEGKNSFLPIELIRFVHAKLKEIVKNFELELSECGYDMRYSQIIYVGGGALVMKNFSEGYRPNVAYDTDVRVNAKGYEFLAYSMIQRG